MKQRVLYLALASAWMAASAQAADWATPSDLDVGPTVHAGTGGPLGISSDAFWLNRSLPVSPTTGLPIDVQAVSERLTLEGEGKRLFSSRRGLLWSDPTNEVGARGQMSADARANGWGIDAGGGALIRRAADGAQVGRWSAATLGAAEFAIVEDGVSAHRVGGGAWVLLRSTDGTRGEALSVDEAGRVLKRLDVPTTLTRIIDDGRGGVFGVDTGSITHLGDSPSERWSINLSSGTQSANIMVTDAGALAIESIGSYVNTWRFVTPNGQQVLQKQAHLGAAHAGGIWLWSGLDGKLTHYRDDGTVIASIGIEMPKQMIAHANGHLLVDVGRNTDYVVYGNHAETIHRHDSTALMIDSNRGNTSYNAGQPMRSIPGTDLAVLIDRNGAASSAPFSWTDNAQGAFWHAKASDTTLCVERKKNHPQVPQEATPKVTCQDRASGTALGLDVHVAEPGTLLDVGDVVRIRTKTAMLVYSRDGMLLNRVPLDGAIDLSTHPELGLAALMQEGSGARLKRYALDGTLLFDQAIVGNALPLRRVFLGNDGSVLLFRAGQFGSRIERLDGNGNTVGTRALTKTAYAIDVVDAQSSVRGVQIVLQHSLDGATAYGNEVVVLSPDLSIERGRHAMPSAWRDHSTLTSSASGDAFYLSASNAGLVLVEIDSGNGEIRAKRVLPVAERPALTAYGARQYHVDADGTLWMYDVGRDGDRRALHRSPPTPEEGVALAQRALQGAWYAESATGQGLVIEIDDARKQLFAAWHTYDRDAGNALSGQRWFTITGALGDAVGRAVLPIYLSRDGRFDQEGQIYPTVAGQAELVATRCDSMELWYHIGDNVGALPLHRAGASTHDCRQGTTTIAAADPLTGVDASGAWFDRNRGGQGLVLASGGDNAGYLFGGWFAYDVDGAKDDANAHHWFTLLGQRPQQYGQTVSTTLYRTIGGSIDGKPTRNAHPVGHAEFTQTDCSSATLTYQFDDSAIAGDFANMTRAIQLSRLGACPQ